MLRAFSRVLTTLSVAAAALSLPVTGASAIDPPTVRVTPGVSSVLLGETRQLTATVANLSNTAVTWSVRSGAGSVSATGLYTPPATLPASPVAIVRAASQEDPGVYGDAAIAIASGVPGGGFGAEVPTGEGRGQDADMADITGDGVADIVVMQNCCNGLKVGHLVSLAWNGSGFTRTVLGTVSTFAADGFTSTQDYILDIELADLDGDGDVDIYVPFGSTQAQTWRYQVWRNNGTGAFTADARVATAGGARSGAEARLVDFDADGRLDAVRLEWFGGLLLEKGNGNGTFQSPVPLMSTFEADSFDVGDLTGDGRPEIAVGIKGTSDNSTSIEVGINDGFGSIASEVTYNVGMAPEPRIADSDGDGWNDLVVGVGGEQYTHFPPKLLALKNLATGTGAVSTTPVQLLAFRPYAFESVHVDGDGVLDLAGYTYRGPVMLRRTGPNAYAPIHTASGDLHHATWGDVTGDGRTDVFTNFDNGSQFWPGTADTTLAFAISPTVSRVNAGHTALMSESLRNSPVEPKVTWTASRGSFPTGFFADSTYTAPATASPTGTTVTVRASLNGTTEVATRQLTVVNDKFQFTSLGGRNVRHVAYDPSLPNHLYAATDTGVQRSTTGGATFSPLGTTATTGTDAKQVQYVADGAGGARVLAIFGTTLYRLDLAGGDWSSTGQTGVTSLSVAPGTPVVWIAAGGQVRRSADAGSTFAALGQTSVTEVDAIDGGNVWVVRSAAPRVSRASYTDTPSPALTMTARELPTTAAVHTLAVHPTNRTLAYVATTEAAVYRDAGGNGGEGSPMWTAHPLPGAVDRLSVSSTGVVLAGRATSREMYKSTDDGTWWHSLDRGFPSSTVMQTLAHRADGLDLVGTNNAGLYTPVEQVPPAAPEITGGPAGTTPPGGANAFTFAFTATGTSQLCALDDTAWTACSGTRSYSGPLASGSHTFSVLSLDENGNESPIATRTWTVDATPAPVPTILTGPTGVVRSTAAAFTFELTGDAAGATCQLDSATPVSCVSGVSYSSLAQGAHTFSVRSVDPAGNLSAAATRTWTIDTVPPAWPGFWQTPQWRTSSTNAFFQWQTDQGATYTCALDGSPVTCGSQSASLLGLAEGDHTFRVTASDAAGNSVGNEHTWHVDLTNPAPPVITVKPDATTGLTSAHFEFVSASDDVSYYWCLIDGTPNYCYGEVDYTNLAFGTHTFAVRAYDHAQRVSETTTYQWTISVPAPAITAGPTGLVGSRSASFAFTLANGATAACSLDGATPAPCTSGVSYASLADGPHTFSVTQTVNGATSPASTRSWTVDATAPAAPVLTTVPPLRTASSSGAFGWTVDPELTYSCTLDSVAVTCGTGAYGATVGGGSHTFVLTARDAALNAATASYTWTVDQTAPVVSLSSAPPVRTAAGTATFEFGSAASDLAGYTCTVDGVVTPCTSPLNLPSVAQGQHTFSVVARDDLNNTSTPVTHTWTVDQTGPAVSLTSAPPSVTPSTGASFAFSSAAPDLAGFVCTIDGVTGPCTSPVTLSSLGAGPHSFSVVAKDDLDNAGQAATHAWTVDTAGPDVTITAAPATRTSLTTATFEFAAPGGDVASYTCTVNGTASTCTSPLVLQRLGEGAHTFTVFARDGVDNVGATATHTWTIDRTGPLVALTDKPAARTGSQAATFAFDSDDDDVDRYECTVDGATDDCASPLELTSLGEGAHAFAVVAYDDLGNARPAVTHAWTVDLTGPAVTFQTVPSGRTNVTQPLVEFSSTAEDVASFLCDLDGEAEPCTSPYTPVTGAGAHTLSVWAVDDVGNAGTPATATWTVDTTAPVTTMPVLSTALNPTHTVSFSEPVNNANVSTVRLWLTGTNTAVPSTVTCRNAANAVVACNSVTVQRALLVPTAPLTPGQLYTFKVSGVTDLAGTPAAVVSRDYRASTLEQETSLNGRSSWRRAGWAGAQGGSYHLANVRGATATYAFTGTSITWFGVRGPSYGLADVYVDNVLKASRVNFYSSSTGALTRTISGLSNAKHTLKIVVRGERGSSAGTGTYVAVDAFRVGSGAVSAHPPITMSWGRFGAAGASGGAYVIEGNGGATYTVTFRGRGVDWVTALGPNMGKATVTIDGVSKGTFDNYASGARWGYVRTFTGLADKVHTMTITVLGQRRSGATGTNVVVDRFGFRP